MMNGGGMMADPALMGLHPSHHRHQQAWQHVYSGQNDHNKHHWGHELIASAIAFEAMRMYEKRRAAEGYHDHALAREIIAAIVAA